jgi:hypothetical protein
MPPATQLGVPSSITRRAALAIASRPEAQWREITSPPEVTGIPAAIPEARAMLNPTP